MKHCPSAIDDKCLVGDRTAFRWEPRLQRSAAISASENAKSCECVAVVERVVVRRLAAEGRLKVHGLHIRARGRVEALIMAILYTELDRLRERTVGVLGGITVKLAQRSPAFLIGSKMSTMLHTGGLKNRIELAQIPNQTNNDGRLFSGEVSRQKCQLTNSQPPTAGALTSTAVCSMLYLLWPPTSFNVAALQDPLHPQHT